jgi:hypothetical protein
MQQYWRQLQARASAVKAVKSAHQRIRKMNVKMGIVTHLRPLNLRTRTSTITEPAHREKHTRNSMTRVRAGLYSQGGSAEFHGAELSFRS